MPIVRLTFLFFLIFCSTQKVSFAARCLYVSSYHSGYEWNDSVEQGLDPILKDICEIKKYYMDGKRNRTPEFAKEKAEEIMTLIKTWKPDVLIASDDNASKYLVKPHLKDTDLPVVFCGVNWTADEYGYPYKNTTGMIEVGPIETLAKEVLNVVPQAQKGIFLSADEITQYKEVTRFKATFEEKGVIFEHLPVTTMADWEKGYTRSQQYDFIVIGNNAGINDWDKKRAADYVLAHSNTFTVSYLSWMAPYSMLTMSKVAKEQGEWAGKVAAMIIAGTKPHEIPIVSNRKWDMYINIPLIQKTDFNLSPYILEKALKVN